MIKLTIAEWELFLASVLYEKHDLSAMSDSRYDYKSSVLANNETINIPNFDPNTGIWAVELLNSLTKEEQDVLNKYAMWWYALGEGTYIGHVLPEDWIVDYQQSYQEYREKLQSSKPFK